jgi:arylesterase/paraoxonase
LDERIRCGDFEHIYNHWPENCTSYSLNGSEDIALFPNQQAVISSGLYFWEFEGIIEKPVPKMYMFDFKKSEQGPIELAMDVDQKDFNPHGVGHWVSAEGDYIIYVVSHQKERDTVESFYFNGEDKSLQHRRSIQHPLLRQMNDLVVVGLDEFYVTKDHYFSHPALQKMEFILRLPLCSVVYFNQDTAKRVAAGLTLANGIAKSNNGRF